MGGTDWVNALFRSIDERDADAFTAFLSDRVAFRFGNGETVRGRAAVGDAVRAFFHSIKGLRHELADTWHQDDAVICHGTVTYTRHDASTLTVPFANILRTRAGLVDEYLIYVDVTGLYATAQG